MANPWIAAAEARRELPDAIYIRVKEREAIAKVELSKPFYLDGEGQMVGPVDLSDQTPVPVVTGLEPTDIDLNSAGGSRVFNAVMEILGLMRQHPGALQLHDLSRIHADPDTGLTLFRLQDGLAIKMGFGGYDSKLDRLLDIISYLRQGEELSNVDFVDLNDVDRVVVKPLGKGSTLQVCYRKEV